MSARIIISRARVLELKRSKTKLVGACWVWPGTPSGERQVYRDDRRVRHSVHRIFYAAYRGPIPKGREIHHECRNGYCVNPKHLVALTPAQHRKLHPFSRWAKKAKATA